MTTSASFPLNARHFSGGKNVVPGRSDDDLASILNYLAGGLGAGGSQADIIFDGETELTIASGAVTATQAWHRIDGQGDAADDLDTISGTDTGEFVLIQPENAARPITLKDGTGNIRTPFQQDLILTQLQDFALLFNDGTSLVVVAWSLMSPDGGADPYFNILASTDGAALVGVEDSDGLVAGSTAEAALRELAILNHSAQTNPGLTDGSSAGNVQTGNACDFKLGGQLYTKAATDDLWDLSGETDTGGSDYRAYSLELNASGTASFQASGNQASAAAAFADLPAIAESRIGIFIADPSCDFDDGGGLAAQGTYYDGSPTSV